MLVRVQVPSRVHSGRLSKDSLSFLFSKPSNIYQYGKLAYIGGGFGVGIHNILEAVAFGLPIIFGPNYQRFNEATELIKQKGAVSISNYKELTSAINFFNTFDKSIAINYIQENSGATDAILNQL